MRKLDIPVALSKEFETVLAMWQSQAETRRVDALLLSWIKHEKQLRRLFCFLVFQHPDFSEHDIDDIIVVLAERYDISPEVFRRSIDTLGCKSIAGLLGQTYVKHANDMERIRLIRNKLMHGQITGMKISSPQLERDVQIVIDWIAALAVAAQQEFGYDGVKRNTFSHAKSANQIGVQNYPFQTTDGLREWLTGVINKVKKDNQKKYKNARRT